MVYGSSIMSVEVVGNEPEQNEQLAFLVWAFIYSVGINFIRIISWFLESSLRLNRIC